MHLNDDLIALLRAAVDRIIPADEHPGAWDAGVGDYIGRLLASGDLRADAAILVECLSTLDAEAMTEFQRPFTELAGDEQDQLFKSIESGQVRTPWPHPPKAFFLILVNLTAEGYYSDPGSGGNRGARSWEMIGFTPTPRPR